MDTIERLLEEEDTDIKIRLLGIIEKMIRITGRKIGEDSEDRQKLIKKYNQKILDIIKKEDIEIRAIAIQVLIEMDDDNFIKPLTNFILDENFNIDKFNFPFGTMRMINKRKLKRELLIKLDENTVLSDPIKQRMRKILEETRRDY